VSLPKVRINRRAADRLRAGHVWVYLSDILNRENAPAAGVVSVEDPQGHFLGTAHHSSTSQIALRLLAREHAVIDRPFLLKRLRAAVEHRSRIVKDSEAYRLVFSEADLLPGLIVDRYGEYLVVQALTQAMDALTPILLDCLTELLSPRGILLRNDSPVRAKESLVREVRVAAGEMPDRAEFQMNGFRWVADLVHGQKTGLYLDQRENYAVGARYAHGAALDCFTSTGGFAVHLSRKCSSVYAADASAAALARAGENAALNGISNISWREADIFDLLTTLGSQRRNFDTVILDPPAFAKSKSAIDKALAGYKEINLKALRLLSPGGILVTCSCSHHVSEADFFGALAAAAIDAHCTLRILERRIQAQDHPVLLTVPETLYLKCVIAEVIG
jgi:23S rRNA (cytosine1962-C5)-methyltransferase